MALWLKICGITSVEDALDAVEAGADAIGVNFVPTSKRFVDVPVGRAVRDAVGERALVVGVVADRSSAELEELRRQTGIAWLQLHGNETPDYCSLIQRVKVIKAFRVDSSFRVESLRSYGSTMFLLDSGSGGQFGGTGKVFDWNQAYGANAFGWIVLAGGLTSVNVGEAVSRLHPFGVDVSSGVESSPGKKDYEKMRRFIETVRKTDVALLGES
jgi:phosphoribosylanthranilate isomerase